MEANGGGPVRRRVGWRGWGESKDETEMKACGWGQGNEMMKAMV